MSFLQKSKHVRRPNFAALAMAVALNAGAISRAADAVPLSISEKASNNSFPLVDRAAAEVLVDDEDAKVVGLAARLFAEDVEQVTGVRPQVRNASTAQTPRVVIGTIGQSKWIDGLVSSGKLDVKSIRGKWEAYTLALVTDPWPGVKQALVVAGADRRGTAYGVFTLSQAIGVSPWAWWADVNPTKRSALFVDLQSPQTDAPHVRYRGLFINDEDWGLTPWAGKTFDPTNGNVGPKTYAKVFELMLRLKANYLWPAMHASTREFAKVPGNVELADEWAIVMGASHAEPMNRNNIHWNDENRGPWRYDTNRQNVFKYWEEYAKSRGKYEAVWTVGMRGVHDTAMQGPADIADRVKILSNAITDQRGLLAKYVKPDVKTVPQAFMPYKEALGLYQAGLKVPDDVTLVWCEDNYGYVRQLSTPEEQKRSGGSGMYYHISYLGNPGTYLWVESTAPALIWAEMNKALQYGTDRIWVLNVGDIKNNEIGADFWLRYAWRPEQFQADAQQTFLHNWAAATFGETHAGDVASVLNDYFQLSMQRKPEHSRPSVFKADGYGEAQARMEAFKELERRATALSDRLPAEKRDGYYSLVLYKVRAAAGVAESYGYVELNRLAAAQGRPAAEQFGTLANAAVEKMKQETTAYNDTFLNGKWKRMITFRGLSISPTNRGWMYNILLKWPDPLPTQRVDGPAKVGIAIDGNDSVLLDGTTPPVETGSGDINLDFKNAEVASPWQRKGNLIGVPDGVGEVTKPEDARPITVPFTVQEDGTYNLFGLVVMPDNKADSFYVRVDDGKWATWNDVPGSAGPTWRKQGQYTLKAGRHKITIGNREDGAQIAGLRFARRDSAEVPDQRYATPGRLPTLANAAGRNSAVFHVFNTDGSSIEAKARPSADWIQVQRLDAIGGEQSFSVAIDFGKAPKSERFNGEVIVDANGKTQPLSVHGVRLPADKTFGEVDGVISIPAAQFSQAKAGKAAEWFTVPGLGREGAAVTIRPATTPSLVEPERIESDSPVLEFTFVAEKTGEVSLNAYCLPTHRIHEGRGQRYAVAIDDAKPTIVDFSADGGESGEGGARWSEGRMRNTLISVSQHQLTRPGRHTLKLWMVDPGVIVDKLVLDLGGLRDSELGPPPTIAVGK